MAKWREPDLEQMGKKRENNRNRERWKDQGRREEAAEEEVER